VDPVDSRGRWKGLPSKHPPMRPGGAITYDSHAPLIQRSQAHAATVGWCGAAVADPPALARDAAGGRGVPSSARATDAALAAGRGASPAPLPRPRHHSTPSHSRYAVRATRAASPARRGWVAGHVQRGHGCCYSHVGGRGGGGVRGAERGERNTSRAGVGLVAYYASVITTTASAYRSQGKHC
jgi:hypothetical protein